MDWRRVISARLYPMARKSSAALERKRVGSCEVESKECRRADKVSACRSCPLEEFP